MDVQSALVLMENIFESMQRSGTILDSTKFSANTVILGSGSVLDSLGFVTFISDLEERLCDELDKEIYLVYHEIEEFNVGSQFLSANAMAQYIESIS